MVDMPEINVPEELDRLSKQFGELRELYENDRETLVVWDGERHRTNDRVEEAEKASKALGLRTDSQVSEIGRRLDGLADACSSADRQATRVAEKHDGLADKLDSQEATDNRRLGQISERLEMTRSRGFGNSNRLSRLEDGRPNSAASFLLMLAVAVVGMIPGIIALVQ